MASSNEEGLQTPPQNCLNESATKYNVSIKMLSKSVHDLRRRLNLLEEENVALRKEALLGSVAYLVLSDLLVNSMHSGALTSTVISSTLEELMAYFEENQERYRDPRRLLLKALTDPDGEIF